MGADLVGGTTKALRTKQSQQPPIPVVEQDGFDCVQLVQTFEYLGFDIKFDGDCVVNIINNISSARKAFWGFAQTVWYVKELSLSTKLLALGQMRSTPCCMVARPGPPHFRQGVSSVGSL